MKKILTLCLISCMILTGCEQATGNYKEGIYEGSAVDNYNGTNTATAKVTIDKNGKIQEVYLDTTYTTIDGVETTKKTLKEEYGMKKGNGAGFGSSEWEWYEQAENLEKAVVENQDIKFLKLDEDGFTDAVSGCTMRVDALTKAIEDALNKAKK